MNRRPLHFFPLPFGMACGWRLSDDGEWSIAGDVKRVHAGVNERDGLKCLSIIIGPLALWFGWSSRS